MIFKIYIVENTIILLECAVKFQIISKVYCGHLKQISKKTKQKQQQKSLKEKQPGGGGTCL